MEKTISKDLNSLFDLDLVTPMFGQASTDVLDEDGSVGSCGSETETELPW